MTRLSPSPEMVRSWTNTKTPVKTIKQRLGILGDPKEEDKWAQFNRSSKRVYDCHMQDVDPNKTFLELPFDLRNRLTRMVLAQFPSEWRGRFDRRLLEDISNTRLFRLHHRSRLKNRRCDDAASSRSGAESEMDPEALTSPEPEHAATAAFSPPSAATSSVASGPSSGSSSVGGIVTMNRSKWPRRLPFDPVRSLM